MASNAKVNRFVDAMLSGEPQNNNKGELPEETQERLQVSPELIEALNKERTKNVGRPRKRPSMEDGTKQGETRATFIVNKELLRKVKYISVMETTLLKDIIGEAISAYVEQWENENGTINLPKAKRQ